jgi:hypothetical protein
MKKEGTIGTAAFLTIAAVVGISLQFGSKQSTSGQAEGGASPKQSLLTSTRPTSAELKPGCMSIEQQFQDFLNADKAIAPPGCYGTSLPPGTEIPEEIAERTSKLRFVIATLPDPLHTHQAVLFDQFAAAIQDAAQDEHYDFDSSWLPWEDEATSYALLADQEKAYWKKEQSEQQPGIFLFRNPAETDGGLVVFVVGEDATHGIHKGQFQNALAWFEALVPDKAERKKRLAILGPTFSGSLPSLTQLLWDHPELESLDVFSGSVSSEGGAAGFRDDNETVTFHSFVQSDKKMLTRFCTYMNWDNRDDESFAILSEDETAYGTDTTPGMHLRHPDSAPCTENALKLYYPRDISALRGAYQTKSIFGLQAGSQPSDAQRSLPTDLADPAGKVRDSIRSYGGNQTPLEQEAFLLEIVAALRDLHAHYILLRGSNPLDQLFLANFLRRMYPSGRIVILTSDLLFIRERGSTGLNGTMTLTNYPLFPLARDWTEHEEVPAADRAFSSDTSEGTYIAFRVLLSSRSLNGGTIDASRCHLAHEEPLDIFVPEVVCNKDPVPDYSPPYWVAPDNCSEDHANGPSCSYPGPATWLTVIGVNRFWPIASLTDDSQLASDHGASQVQPDEPGTTLTMPPGMKLFFAVLIAFSLFHAWCCWYGSYTAKPNFRAHFASVGGWRHTVLVFFGSSLLAFIGIVAAWGCGAFFLPAYTGAQPWLALSSALTALGSALIVCVIAWLSIIGRTATVWRLSAPRQGKRIKDFLIENWFQNLRVSLIFLAVLAFFGLHVWIWEHNLDVTDGALTYWRAMNLGSGVSPIVPQIALLVGLYFWFWLALHGLALFGSDHPRLPLLRDLKIKIKNGEQEEKCYDLLRMFSQQGAAKTIEKAGMPLGKKTLRITAASFVLFLLASLAFGDGVFLRGLGPNRKALILMLWLLACISLQLAEAWRLCELWQELRNLLTFLDRLPLRGTLAVMQGISWSNVWKMGGNVLEVRYKVISRQLESMNHSIASLEEVEKDPKYADAIVQSARDCLTDLKAMRAAGFCFARWYQDAYRDPNAGDLTAFKRFQRSVAKASGVLLAQLLIPAWRKEKQSLIVSPGADKEAATPSTPNPAKEEYVRNAEEFVCLTYLGFIQNIIGRLRTLATTIMVLFFATTISLSAYPFDPRQVLSAILIILFIALGIAVVKVYAEMHRDATLSYVTNTKPGALDPEFWFKVLGFGLAPLVGLLTRIFPDISDFIFAWIQPSISSLK